MTAPLSYLTKNARHPEGRRAGLAYRADLDGLRALAVLGVLVDHATLPAGIPTGTVGVTAFFVLSGFLITSLLLEEHGRTGRVDLRAFYLRRVRRLAPGFAVLLAFVIVVGLAGWSRGPWLPGVAGSVLYVGNWIEALGGTLGPLAQTWSLAIEEQFYLVWPALLLLGGRRGLTAAAVAGIAVAVVLRPEVGGTFAYYATFTRIDAILGGCLLAVAAIRLPRAFGWLGLALLGVACLPMDNTVRLPLATIATTLVIAGRLDALGWLAPLGRRAYAIYLWDWPLTYLIGPGAGLLALPIAEVSWRTIEARFRSGRREAPRPWPMVLAAR